ncbi:MAG: AraC family transcriptional regulator [Bacteroidota bacterium]
MRKDIHREITPLAPQDSFLVFERVKRHFDFPVHFHPELEINMILGGKGCRRIVGDSIEEIEDVELVLVGPNLEHGWETHHAKGGEIHEVTIQFHNDLLDDRLLSRHIFKPLKDLLIRANHGILFSPSIVEQLKPRIISLSKIGSIDYFLEFISILYDLANSRNQRLLSTYTASNSHFENSPKIEQVYTFIQQNFHRQITLNEISEMMNMSQVTFNRFMKKRTGKTFVEYLNDTRISYASRWLIETDQSIGEIAYKCGFNNIANFNRVFKKSKDCTPSEFKIQFEGIKRVL